MLNHVSLVGRLACDPKLKTFASGVTKATLVLAVERDYTTKDGEDKVDYIYVDVWRKAAENCGNYLQKGSLVGVEGRVQVDRWEDEESNKKYYKTIISAKNVKFLDSKRKKEASA